MPLTLDGYPYPSPGPPDNNWNWIKTANWRSSIPANNFMVEIGDRRPTGLANLAQRMGDKGFKFVANAIAYACSFIPIPGIAVAGQELKQAIINETKQLIGDKLKQFFSILRQNKTLDFIVQNVKIPLYIDNTDFVQKFDALDSGHARSIVIHSIVDRWGWNKDVILSLDFERNIDAQKTFITMVVARMVFTRFEWFENWKNDPRKFFYGDGVVKTLTHFGGSQYWNPDSQSDLETMRTICDIVGSLEIYNDEAEYNRQKALIDQNMSASQSTSGKDIKNIDMALLGLLALPLIKR